MPKKNTDDLLTEDDAKGIGASSDDADELVVVETPLDNRAASDSGANDDEDDDEDDRPVKASDSEEDDREAIRERRRQEKVERKQRREEAIKRDKLERDFLLKRNEELERRLVAQEQRAAQVDLNTIEAQIQNAAREAETAEKVIAKAVEAGNGADVTQALRYRDQALARLQQLSAAKQAAIQRPAPAAPPVDDMTMMHAQNFLRENSWYDPQGRDEDSAIVLAIDQALVRDGYNPQTEEYWGELRKRAARRLPERFKSQEHSSESSRTPRGGPVVGSGREHAPATTRREIYISPERKQALIDAGVWDDPVLRTKFVKRYAEYDRLQREKS